MRRQLMPPNPLPAREGPGATSPLLSRKSPSVLRLTKPSDDRINEVIQGQSRLDFTYPSYVRLYSVRNDDVRIEAGLQKINQFRVHESVVVRYVEANDSFVGEEVGVFFLKSSLVLLLHDENQVCPSDVASRDFDTSVYFSARRSHGVTVEAVKELLGS